MRKLIINENERRNILSKFDSTISIDENVVITDWLSPDEKYIIFLDELYDLENKTKIGDVWKNPNNLVLFLEHSFGVSNLESTIKEHAKSVFRGVLLTEGTQDFTNFKPIMKQYLTEGGVWDSFKKWMSDTASSTVQGIKDFTTDSIEGIKKYGDAISRGDWEEVWNLLKKGTLWLARKLRQALYSPVGLIVDAILIATGVGKGFQIVAWAIVVALDVYEFATGDYEHKDDPMWLRIVFFAIDILGLVSAGVAAKMAKVAVAGIKTESELAALLTRNPAVRESLIKMGYDLPKLSEFLSKYAAQTSKSAPKVSGFLAKMAQKAATLAKSVASTLAKIFSMAGLKAAAKTFAIVAGLGTGIEYYKSNVLEPKIKKDEELMAQNAEEKKEKDQKDLDQVSQMTLGRGANYDEFL